MSVASSPTPARVTKAAPATRSPHVVRRSRRTATPSAPGAGRGTSTGRSAATSSAPTAEGSTRTGAAVVARSRTEDHCQGVSEGVSEGAAERSPAGESGSATGTPPWIGAARTPP